MKYGVVVYRETANIGDDIQSYAAANLLPSVDYYIEREHMDIFRPREPEPVNTIVNGWFMNNKLAWPISPFINPLYTSMHFLEHDSLLIEDEFLKGLGGRDLKEHAPIGCRDTETQRLLEKNDIKTYFSGCLTLTLPRKNIPASAERYVCLTDVSEEVQEYVRKHYPQLNLRVIEHEPNKLPPIVDKQADWPTRFRRVEELLVIYQNASAVITTRLHCAMPCLALGTPVLFLRNTAVYDSGRLEGLESLTNHADTKCFLNGEVDFNLHAPPANPDAYLPIREHLIKTVNLFLSENQACTAELNARAMTYDSQWEEKALWKNEILLRLLKKHAAQWNETQNWIKELERNVAWQEETRQRHVEELNELRQWCTEQGKGIEWLKSQNESILQERDNLQKSLDSALAAKQAAEKKLNNLPRVLRNWIEKE